MSAENILTDADSNTSSTDSAVECLGLHGQSIQNRESWPNLATMCERYLVSDRVGAAIANAALQDAGVLDKTGMSMINDGSKLRREHSKYGKEIIAEESLFFDQVGGIYFDERKDSPLVLQNGISNKSYRTKALREHYVISFNTSWRAIRILFSTCFSSKWKRFNNC